MCDTDLASAILFYRWVDDEVKTLRRRRHLGGFLLDRLAPGVPALVFFITSPPLCAWWHACRPPSVQGWARCRRALMGPYRMLPPVEAVVGRMTRKACFTRTWEQVGAQGVGGLGPCMPLQRAIQPSMRLSCEWRGEGFSAARKLSPAPAGLSTCACRAQGIARHSDADRLSMVEEELGGLSELLGEQPYLFGDRWDLHAGLLTNLVPSSFASRM